MSKKPTKKMITPSPKRLVFFMCGRDIAGTSRYHVMMRQQHRYYSKRFGVPMTVSAFEKNVRPDSHFSNFSIEAEWPEGKTNTNYYVSDWQAEVEEQAKKSDLHRIPHYLYGYAHSWLSGIFAPLFKRQPRAAIVFSIPLIGLLARLIVGFLLFKIATTLLDFFEIEKWLEYTAAIIWGFGLFKVVEKVGDYFDKLYEAHLADSVIFQYRLTFNQDETIKREADVLSKEIVKTIDQEKPDEVYIIGHSCGCFHSLPAHKALLEARRSGNHYTDYQLLHITKGSLLPYTARYKKNSFFRSIAADLLNDKETNWIEYFAPQDPFSVPYMRLDKDYGFDLKTPLPARYDVRSAVFGEVFAEKKLKKFKYNPLRMHFQYLTANDVAGAYDFFYIITHPDALKNQLKPPQVEKPA